MSDLKPIDETYARSQVTLRPGDRLHRIVQRMADTYIDDLTDDRILAVEQLIDSYRLTHASGVRFPHQPTEPK